MFALLTFLFDLSAESGVEVFDCACWDVFFACVLYGGIEILYHRVCNLVCRYHSVIWKACKLFSIVAVKESQAALL